MINTNVFFDFTDFTDFQESGNIGSRNHTLQETALIHLNPPLDLSLNAHEKMLPDTYLRAGLSRRSGFMRGEWAVCYLFETCL